MKNIFNFIFLIAILCLTSCDKSMIIEDSLTSDELLIIEIDNANNKEQLEINSLPTVVKIDLNENFNDMIAFDAYHVNQKGYLVLMGSLSSEMGRGIKAFYSINGRALVGKNRDYKYSFDEENSYLEKNWKCFDIVYPITFFMEDSMSIIIQSNEDSSWNNIKMWYKNNPESDFKLEVQYPIEIYIEETLKIINNNLELREAYNYCRKDDDEFKVKRSCFDLTYPITYVTFDNTEFIINSEDDESSWDAVKEWFESTNFENEVHAETFSLVYPVDIVVEDDMVFTINSEEEMSQAKRDYCSEWDED